MLTIHINPVRVTPSENQLHIFTTHRPDLIALQLMLFFYKKERYQEELFFDICGTESTAQAHAIVKLFYDMRLSTGHAYPGTFEQMQLAGFYQSVDEDFYEQIKKHIAQVYFSEL